MPTIQQAKCIIVKRLSAEHFILFINSCIILGNGIKSLFDKQIAEYHYLSAFLVIGLGACGLYILLSRKYKEGNNANKTAGIIQSDKTGNGNKDTDLQ